MKIVLILPRGALYRYGTGAFYKYLRYAPLTLSTLAALIPHDLGADVELYDEGVESINRESISADLIGLTAITGASPRAYAYADYFRSRGMTVVMGGVHATLMPEEAKQHVDAVVMGPAYETWPELLYDFQRNSLKPFYHPPKKIDFSKVPLPMRNKLRGKRKFFTLNSVQAVFGCPNACEFCVTPYVCRGYQHRPIPDVVSEIASLKGRYFSFVDPSPIEDVEYAIALCKAIAPLNKIWTSLATTRLLYQRPLMDAMERSGCRGLLIGFESLSQQSNNGVRKAFNKVSEYYSLVRELHARGIAIMGCFVHGLDEDDKDCFSRTLEFVNKANIDLPRFTICTPFPGTRFFRKLKNEKRIITENWSLFDAQHVVFKPKKMTVEELRDGHEWIWKEAYNLSSITKRLAFSRSFLWVSVLTNIGYRKYGRALPRYREEKMSLDALSA